MIIRGARTRPEIRSIFIALGVLFIIPAMVLSYPEIEDLAGKLDAASQLEADERWDEAREIYLESGADHPRDRRVLFGLERIHRHVQDDGRYYMLLRENFRHFPADGVLFRHYLTRAAREVEQQDLLPDIRIHLEQSERNEAFYRNLHAHLLRLNLLDLAEEVLLTGERELNDSIRFARELSDLYFRQGDGERSFDEMLNALERTPGALVFADRRIVDLRGMLRAEEMIDIIEERIETAEPASPYLHLLADLWIDEGKMDRALSTLSRLIDEDPASGTKALEDYVTECEVRQVLPEATEALRLLVDARPDRRAEYELTHARLQREMGDPDRARDLYRRMLENDPRPEHRSQILLALGDIALYDLHRWDSAVEWYAKVGASIAEPDRQADAVQSMLLAYVYGGHTDTADSLGDRSEGDDLTVDRRVEVDFLRGAVKILEGRVNAGKKLLETVSRRRGHVRANDAIEFLLWLDKDPSPELAVSRGLIWHRLILAVGDVRASIDRLESIQKASRESPLAGEVLCELAIVHRRSGQYREAIEFLEAVVSNHAGNRLAPKAEWLMAKIYWKDLGRSQMAKPHLERIIHEYSGSVYAPKARRALERIDRNEEPLSMSISVLRGVGESRKEG
jgi:tetratricopeptide (TPR) repeat protein